MTPGEWYLPEGFLKDDEHDDTDTSNDELDRLISENPINDLLDQLTMARIRPKNKKNGKKAQKRRKFMYEDINVESDIELLAKINRERDEKEEYEEENNIYNVKDMLEPSFFYTEDFLNQLKKGVEKFPELSSLTEDDFVKLCEIAQERIKEKKKNNPGSYDPVDLENFDWDNISSDMEEEECMQNFDYDSHPLTPTPSPSPTIDVDALIEELTDQLESNEGDYTVHIKDL